MARAYTPRQSTLDIVATLSAWAAVERVRVIAPRRGALPRPAMLRVYYVTGRYEDMALSTARDVADAVRANAASIAALAAQAAR